MERRPGKNHYEAVGERKCCDHGKNFLQQAEGFPPRGEVSKKEKIPLRETHLLKSEPEPRTKGGANSQRREIQERALGERESSGGFSCWKTFSERIRSS